VEVDLVSTDRPITPLERGTPRLVSVGPGLRSTGCEHQWASVVISSQTGSSGAPKITDDQPCSGGSSQGASQHHWRTGAPRRPDPQPPV
jgi:hypothetical protein